MPPTTRFASAQDGLETIIKARRDLAGNPLASVAIDVGDPGRRLKKEHVWIAEEADARQSWETTGATTAQREETARLFVTAFVTQSGDDYRKARNRLLALAQEIETAVRNDPALNASVWHAEMAGWRTDGWEIDNARGVIWVWEVSYTAFLA